MKVVVDKSNANFTLKSLEMKAVVENNHANSNFARCHRDTSNIWKKVILPNLNKM